MELKPCPFCGANTNKITCYGGSDDYYLQCQECGTIGPGDVTTKEAAEINWNTRPIEDSLQHRIKELEAEREKLREELEDTRKAIVALSGKEEKK